MPEQAGAAESSERGDRGGPQLIPRPSSARPGPTAPWAHLSREERHVDLSRVITSLRAAGPPRPSPWEPPLGARRSAVLVPLFEEGSEAWVVLTRRAQHLRAHKGEVAFPGGRQDDGETLVEAALREAREEIALETSVVEIVGELDHLATVSSNSSIVPFVGVLPGRPVGLLPNPDEVEAVLVVPLGELLHDDVFRSELWPWQDETGLLGDRPLYFFDLYGDTIWGATGRMIVNLLEIVLGLPR